MSRGIYNRKYKEMPPGFADDAPTMTVHGLIEKYHAAPASVLRWMEEVGVQPRGRGRVPTPVVQIDPETGRRIATFLSAKDAAQTVYGVRSYICRCAAGKCSTAYGWKWEYAKGERNDVRQQLPG